MEEIPNTNPLVSVIVLTWNNAEDTLATLESLQKSDYHPFIPVVVDNGSTDGSIEIIRSAFPEVHLIQLGANLGYAAGNNAGIQFALESGADYVLILNNDTLVDPNMIRELVTLAQSSEKYGMVGPMMYCHEPTNVIFAAGGFIDWSKGVTSNRGMFQPASTLEIDLEPEKVDYIPGCGVLVSRQLIDKIGPLNPDYFLNYEDVDWGVRAHNAGFEVWYSPKAVLWHKVSASMGKASPLNTYYMTRNALLFFWKNSPPRYRWQAVMLIILRTICSIGAWTLKPKYWNNSFKRLRLANIMALKDFTLGNFGEMKGS